MIIIIRTWVKGRSESVSPGNLWCTFLLRNEYSIGSAFGLYFELVVIQVKVVHDGKSLCLCPLVTALVFPAWTVKQASKR